MRKIGFWAAMFVAGLAALPAMARTQNDIVYGRAGDTDLKLDVIIPDATNPDARNPSTPTPFPVLIAFHGGGWFTGSREGDIKVIFPPLTQAGFLIFTVEYRLAPANRWPACFDDTQTAIRWVKAHAAEYGGDPHRIALIGYSAGAHLVTYAEVEGGADTAVQAVVGLAAPTDLEIDLARRGGLSAMLQQLLNRPHALTPEARRQLHDLSPVNHVHPGLPPTLLVHGTLDMTVPYPSSVNFKAALEKNGDSCDLITIKGGSHTIARWPGFEPTYMNQMIQWLNEKLAVAPTTRP